jgi:hypothetical protein
MESWQRRSNFNAEIDAQSLRAETKSLPRSFLRDNIE